MDWSRLARWTARRALPGIALAVVVSSADGAPNLTEDELQQLVSGRTWRLSGSDRYTLDGKQAGAVRTYDSSAPFPVTFYPDLSCTFQPVGSGPIPAGWVARPPRHLDLTINSQFAGLYAAYLADLALTALTNRERLPFEPDDVSIPCGGRRVVVKLTARVQPPGLRLSFRLRSRFRYCGSVFDPVTGRRRRLSGVFREGGTFAGPLVQ